MVPWDYSTVNEISLSILMRVTMEVGVDSREKPEKKHSVHSAGIKHVVDYFIP